MLWGWHRVVNEMMGPSRDSDAEKRPLARAGQSAREGATNSLMYLSRALPTERRKTPCQDGPMRTSYRCHFRSWSWRTSSRVTAAA